MKTKGLNTGARERSGRTVRSVATEVRTYGPGEKYFDTLNALLPHVTAMGGYCVGLVSALAWQNGIDPNESVLRAAAECTTALQAIEMYSAWEKLQR